MPPPLFYLESPSHYAEHWPQLKRVACPHCHAVGFLNRHGHLKGYQENSEQKVQRGWRVFCSNRQRRGGCGQTYSILLAHLLRRRSVTTSMVWTFLSGILSGLTLAVAWFAMATSFGVECGDRLWNSWKRAQSSIRSWLCRIGPPQASPQINPLLQPMEHLRQSFPSAQNPIAAFQLHFQQAFFPCT